MEERNMSNVIEPTPEEPNGQTGGPNRTFILIALGLAGLLVVGLLAVFGYVAASRFGLIGTRENPTPVTSPAAATLVLTRAGTAAAGASAVAGTPAAGVTTAAGTPRPGSGTAAAGATIAVAGTPVATRVVSLPTSGSTSATRVAASASAAPSATAVVAAATPTAAGGVTVEATATPTGGSEALPQTGAELDLLIIAGLLVLLLILARSFRSVLRS
jgi:LPXTG-motif cell wall-anchored protein